MIKYIAIALLAVLAVGQISAHDPSESEETSLLMGDERHFAEFCVAERAAITEDIKSRANQFSSKIYQLFFSSFLVEITDDVLLVTRKQVEEFTQTIEAPESLEPVSSGPVPERQLVHRIDETMDAMATQVDRSIFSRLRSASKGVAETIYRTVSSAVFLRLVKIRSMMSEENFLQALVDACHQVSTYEKKIIDDLETEKARLEKKLDQPEALEFVKSMSVEQLNCQTPRYIARMDGLCNVIIGGTNFFLKLFAVDRTFKFPTPSALTPEASGN